MQPIERIRRDVFGVRQSAFAAIAGASQSVVSRWESGESCPNLDQLRRIREAAVTGGLPWDDALFFDASVPLPGQPATREGGDGREGEPSPDCTGSPLATERAA